MHIRFIAHSVAALSLAFMLSAGFARNIVDTATSAGTFGSWMEMLRETGMEKTLSEAGPYTVFIPSDEAFADLPARQRDALRGKELQEKVARLLVVPGKVLLKSAPDGTRLRTLEGKELTVHREGKVIKVDDAEVLEPDVEVDNGVIHVLGTVPLP